MIYTGKEFAPIIENRNNIDKKSLRDDKEYFEREAQNSAHELELAQISIETLEKENTHLQSKLFQAELRIKQLENIFTAQGCTKEQIDVMIGQMMADIQRAG